MNIVKLTLLLVCVLMTFSGVSVAGEPKRLKKSEVAAFIGSQKVLHSLSEEMKAAGVVSFFKYDPKLIAQKNMPIFVENVRIMQKDTPAYYDRLTVIVTGYSHNPTVENTPVYRFTSAEDWASIGDRVMLAHFTENSTATQTGYDDLISALPPGMLDKLDPERRAIVEKNLDLLRSAQNVPEADKKLVESFEERLKKVLFEMVAATP
ncbi:MAG: hypothetical protein COB36_01275 [Alphaproteobacteria bacterium]|nr:MAG: hypothetical protein COB36_01275 [Alphaproteobacteria bacterium]